jgi:hypothetical protein
MRWCRHPRFSTDAASNSAGVRPRGIPDPCAGAAQARRESAWTPALEAAYVTRRRRSWPTAYPVVPLRAGGTKRGSIAEDLVDRGSRVGVRAHRTVFRRALVIASRAGPVTVTAERLKRGTDPVHQRRTISPIRCATNQPPAAAARRPRVPEPTPDPLSLQSMPRRLRL